MCPPEKHSILHNLPLPLQPPPAFLIYTPKESLAVQVSYCARAWQILSLCSSLKGSKTNPRSCLITMLSQWKDLLDKKNAPQSADSKKNIMEYCYIDKIKSGRRWYGVRGTHIWNYASMEQAKEVQEKSCLFMFERLVPDEFNLSVSFRKWRLNEREQELVHLLMAGQTNMEIAKHLDISINTVKGYLKLLMRRLGVNSRTRIISRILTEKNPPS